MGTRTDHLITDLPADIPADVEAQHRRVQAARWPELTPEEVDFARVMAEHDRVTVEEAIEAMRRRPTEAPAWLTVIGGDEPEPIGTVVEGID